jgi:hypothetical protein
LKVMKLLENATEAVVFRQLRRTCRKTTVWMLQAVE